MAKTELTLELENFIYKETSKMGVFGCLEVTIGWFGNERVDYMTYDTKGIWRCYEIKVSKADFHSKANKTFIGNYNYYVMPNSLYEEVKNEISNHIGVYTLSGLCKKAKKKELIIEEKILKDSMIRSLSREQDKFKKTCDVSYINGLKNKITHLEKQSRENQNKYINYSNAIFEICDKYNLDYKEVRKLLRG